jgi:DNA primase
MDSAIEEIKSRIDIVDLLSDYISLKKTGQNYKGLCPFHSEKTPSFMVSPSKQIFYCFGCNKGGDIFTFLMLYEKMSFSEALSFLAEKANVPLHRLNDVHARGAKEVLFSIYKESNLFFAESLKRSKDALNYLKERKISHESIELFSIGYSGKERDSLLNHLNKKGFSPDDIKRSGLVISGKSGVYDFFRDRLIFPIFDLQNRVVAFGGRIMTGQKNLPKYINSPDTLIFKKGELNYGLNIAKNYIVEKGYTIVVEGYLDVIMCHQYGIKNVVAPLGTALTADQLKRIKKLSNNILLLFDGDNAGISAAKRAIHLCYPESLTTKILILPTGEDPDSFLRKYGEREFKKLLGKAILPMEFLLKISGNKRREAIREVIRLIATCPDPLQKEEEIKELAERTKISELSIREEIKNLYKNYKVDTEIKEKEAELKDKDEFMLLSIAITFPEKAKYLLNRLDLSLINNSLIKNIFEHIKAVSEGEGSFSFDKLFIRCSDEEKKILTRLSLSPGIDSENIDKIIMDCLKTIALKNLEMKIKHAIDAEDTKLLNYLFSEKRKIMEECLGRIS